MVYRYTDCLWALCQKVLDPRKHILTITQVKLLVYHTVGDNNVEFEVGDCSVEGKRMWLICLTMENETCPRECFENSCSKIMVVNATSVKLLKKLYGMVKGYMVVWHRDYCDSGLWEQFTETRSG